MTDNVVNLRVASARDHASLKDCRDCKWHETMFGGQLAKCRVPGTPPLQQDKYYAAQTLRAEGLLCGPNAKYFEPLPPPPPTFWQRLFRSRS